MTTDATPDPQKQLAATGTVTGLYRSAVVAMMAWLGMTLGLYRAMRGAGPMSSDDLAQRTGLHERWLREWLRGQAAAGLIEHLGGERFELSPEFATLLTDEDHLSYFGRQFESLPYRFELAQHLPESFRSGLGMRWDDRGEDGALYTELTFRNWHRQVLVPTALPLLDGVVERLRAGARVADVGCGGGIALIEIAKAFPRSELHGYDSSAAALERAAQHLSREGVTNLSFHNVASHPLPKDAGFDFMMTLDCLHDMTHPADVVRHIRAAIKPDGVWFIIDINCAPTFDEQIKHPLASSLYAMSLMGCMSSGLSEPGGAGLGTCGLPEPALRDLVQSAGFTRFRRLDLANPINAYYEVRP
jgi:2-polyprenyl-3-methyl-5-hydroxy-6-metoxy-1,4-benzoquinol methylase